MHTTGRFFAAGAGAALAFLVSAGGSAYAAGGGYGPGAPASNGAPGGFTAVIASKVIGPGGGTLAVTVPGGFLTVEVPLGAFTTSDDVVVTSPDLAATDAGLSSVGFAGFHAVAGAGLSVLDSSGAPVIGRFSLPVTVTITGSSVGTSGEKVLELTGPASAHVVPATLSPGSVSVSVTSDPALVAVNPTAISPAVAAGVPAATSQHTGLPFTGETDLAYGLAGAGLVALGAAGARHRRHRAAR